MAPFYKNVLRPATSWFRQVLFVGGARRNIALGPVLKQFCQKKKKPESYSTVYIFGFLSKKQELESQQNFNRSKCTFSF